MAGGKLLESEIRSSMRNPVIERLDGYVGMLTLDRGRMPISKIKSMMSMAFGLVGIHISIPTEKKPLVPKIKPMIDKRRKSNREPGMVLIMVKGQKAPIPMGRVDDMGSRGSLNGFKTQTKGDDIIIKVRDIGEAANVMNSINQAVWYTSDTNQ